MKIYGNDNTNLTLTDKAELMYSKCDPLQIIEHEDASYSLRGIDDRDGMTAEDVNEWLEDLADEMKEKGEGATESIECRAQEIIENGYYASAVALMDDEIREEVHADLAPCSEVEFLKEYMRRHYAKYGEEFCV